MFELPQFTELPEAPDESDSEGCIQCQMGSKLVLFITGKCHWQCDYCHHWQSGTVSKTAHLKRYNCKWKHEQSLHEAEEAESDAA